MLVNPHPLKSAVNNLAVGEEHHPARVPVVLGGGLGEGREYPVGRLQVFAHVCLVRIITTELEQTTHNLNTCVGFPRAGSSREDDTLRLSRCLLREQDVAEELVQHLLIALSHTGLNLLEISNLC